jgi:hypothetical protein
VRKDVRLRRLPLHDEFRGRSFLRPNI